MPDAILDVLYMPDAILDVISLFPNVWIGQELEIIISSKTIVKM
jgi:hypothetical protein